jgi:hypothetical protein
MKGKPLLACALLAIALASTQADQGDDLQAYYEQQKAELAPEFQPPELGTEFAFLTADGQKQLGILMKLGANEISVLSGSKMVVYKRSALHESCRALLFAEDYAHAKAIERTLAYKEQLHVEGIKDEQASTHDGRISVSYKVEKGSSKAVEEDERENESTGNTTTTTTTTKTRTEVQKLAVTLSNNTTHPDTYTLAWYFYADPIGPAGIAVHDSGSEKITVDARQRVRRDLSSKMLTEIEEVVDRESSGGNYSIDPKVTTTGKESAGYLVLLKYGDTILDQKASSNTYLSKEWLEKL